MNQKDKQELLQRIARYLMLHASFAQNLGLLNGKLGIAIFFFQYARYTEKKIYEDFAGELINEIYKEIHLRYPSNFRDGLCGIAWGIEYLIQNQFVEADPDEVLTDLDKQIRERDVRRMDDISLNTGLSGIAYYVVGRCANRKEIPVLIHQEYIVDLINALKINAKADEESFSLVEQLTAIMMGKKVEKNKLLLPQIMDKTKYNTQKLFEGVRPLGIIDNGFAGIGLKLMMENQ